MLWRKCLSEFVVLKEETCEVSLDPELGKIFGCYLRENKRDAGTNFEMAYDKKRNIFIFPRKYFFCVNHALCYLFSGQEAFWRELYKTTTVNHANRIRAAGAAVHQTTCFADESLSKETGVGGR